MNLESRPKHIQLTRFICQQLLFEFVTGNLEASRQEAMDDFLSECRDSQRELEQLRRALIYASLGAQTQVSVPLREALLGFEPHWKQTLRAWTMWSSQRGWRIFPYVFLVIAILLGVMTFKPWMAMQGKQLTIAEEVKPTTESFSPPPDAVVETAGVTPLLPEAPATAPPPVAAVAQVSALAAAKPPAPETDLEEEQQPVVQSFVLRSEIEVRDFNATWPAIKDKIETLGGKSAGDVELGTLRRTGESYFHFSLPESKQGELEAFLRTFGRVQFRKERATRVMPEEEIRIILKVKDGSESHEGTSETP